MGTAGAPAGIVEQQVEAAEGIRSGGEEGFDGNGIAHIGRGPEAWRRRRARPDRRWLAGHRRGVRLGPRRSRPTAQRG